MGVGNHEVIKEGNPSPLITKGDMGEGVLKYYATRSVPKTAVRGVIVHHNNYLELSVHRQYLDNLALLGIKHGDKVVVEDVQRGIAYPAKVRFGKTVAWLSIPKDFWSYYEKGEEVVVLITPIKIR